MSREFDELSARAWREFSGDVHRSVRRVGQVGAAYVKKHPFLVLAAGGLVAALAIFRRGRPAPVAAERSRREPRGLARKLVQAGRTWMILWLTSASRPKADREVKAPPDPVRSNGRS